MIFVLKMLNRIVLFFVFLGIFSASFAIGAEVQVSEEESAIVLEQFESLLAEIDAVGIFTHNLSLAIPMLFQDLELHGVRLQHSPLEWLFLYYGMPVQCWKISHHLLYSSCRPLD